MNVIVTGASGFLGRELINQLKNYKGFTIYALTSKVEELKENFFEDKNVLIFGKNSIFTKEIKISKEFVLINCAFPRNVGDDFAEGLEYVKGILQSVVEQGVGAVINISSQSVYSSKRKYPASEEAIIQLDSMYAVGKYATELLTQSICKEIPYTNIRMGSLIGPGFDQRVTNKLVDIALNSNILTIKTGKQYWSFLDVADGARGIISLLFIQPEKWRQTYNLGSERAYTLFEIAGEISKILKEDCGIEVNINTIADESEQNTAIDCTALKEDTGFLPQISFKESLMRIIEKKRTKDN